MLGKLEFRKEIESYYDSWFHIDRMYNAWTQKRGFNYNAIFVLDQIYSNEGRCTLSDIQKKLSLPKQTISFILKSLETRGYIIKETDDTDKRSKLLKFTENGKQLAEKLLSEINEIEVQAFSSMSELERASFRLGFKAFEMAIEKFITE